MRILVVEDEQKVASFIQKGLEEEGHAVDVALDGEDGLSKALDGVHDLVVLDIMLPKRDGLSVLREVRNRRLQTPVLLLTARDAVPDRVTGLDAGADDYLVKPFAFDELLARIRALLRRRGGDRLAVLAAADLTLDPAAREVRRAGKKIELTAKEYALLEYLLRNKGRVLNRSLIAQHVWDYDFDSSTNVIDVYINYLRKKVDADFTPRLIHTVRGAGYVLREGGE
jgi:heavy metal response regulator